MSTIQSDVSELKNINTEIKRLQTETKKLKKRAQEIEKSIITYLNEKEQPGVKYQNTAIIVENKTKKILKSKKDIENNTFRILQENGVHNAKEIMDKINEGKKSEEIQMQKVKLQNLKT